MRPKVLSTQGTRYPLDYDKNNKSGFEAWRNYIHDQVSKSVLPTEMLLIEAKKVLTSQSRYIPAELKSNHVKGDKVIYLIMLIAAVVIAILSSN